jgi:pyruvate dehydrogenase E2 component (dihydrolipoamide acetyltransferase)
MSIRRKLMLSTWSAPSEGNIYGLITINAEPIRAYLEKRKAADQNDASGPVKITVTTLMAKAVALAFQSAPRMNSRLVADKFIPKPTIDVSLLVNVDDGSDLAIAKIENCDKKSLKQISSDVLKKTSKLRDHADEDTNKSKPLLKALPVFLVRPLVHLVGYLSSCLNLNIPALGVRPAPFGTAMITSLGMMGVEQAFAPFTPWAHVPILLCVGSIEKKAVVVNDQIIIQHQMCVTATIDHRFVDGAEIAKLGRRLKEVLERPELLDVSPADGVAEKKDDTSN